MNEPMELEYLRDLCDTQKVQIETLHEHLATERSEVARLNNLVSLLESSLDAKNAEVQRLSQLAQGIYLA